jgi:epoxyqueuosine reductase
LFNVQAEDDSEMIVEQIHKLAEEERIPVLGIGPASCLADERPGYRPQDLLPGAESLVCFGLPVPRQVYRMPKYGAETVWRTQNLLYRRLDTLAVRIATLLEESGALAFPVFGCMPLGINERGEVAGYLNQIRMAREIGIGTIGRNGLLLHPRYGARLMLGSVITTADLPALRVPVLDTPGCPPECHLCVDACPVQAISIEDQRVRVMRCLAYTARTPMMSKLEFVVRRAIRPQSAARLMNLTTFDEHTFHVCSRCVACCPYGDEASLSFTRQEAVSSARPDEFDKDT